MSQTSAVLLGALAGGTIFLGLPVARMRGLPKPVQGFLNAFATGILVFLLWDILSHAGEPVEAAITDGQRGQFAAMAVIFAAGVGVGLLGLVYFNRTVFSHLRHGHANPSARSLSLAIATGLGLHNLSEGLAIGQAAHVGAIAFTGVLAIGFALHNITEGFGIAAPMTTEPKPATWGFLGLAGLIGGGPTFIGTWIGYLAGSTYFSVAFLAVAAGALLYVLNELFNVGRRISSPPMFAWGLLGGFLTAFATDLFLIATSGA
ncbi:MAG: zinc permease [Chloroflexi bacterium]|nr:MAG: zinc permease [Chloroflexota bacterium]TMF18452.1 MAG: zinc permease [Chloroflexota bacterium]TMF95219.1 MAG: zinc permease [Chloroflexota bacterium]